LGGSLMADTGFGPKDTGQISLPSMGPGMNKRAPGLPTYEDPKRLGSNHDRNRTKDEKLLARIRKRFDRAVKSESDNRKLWGEALAFKAGKQWSDSEATQRNIDQRPCLTFNRMPVFIRQVTNDQRMNRPAINISPVGAHGDGEAAKMCRGLIRSIERKCNADIAYDTGFDNAVSIGKGYWRILIEWENERSFRQTIAVKRVSNTFTVYWDPDSTEPDGADASHAFVTEVIPKDEFEAKWPDAQPVPFELAGQGDKYKAWLSKDGMRICEYFEVKKEKATVLRLDNGWEGYEDDLDDVTKERIKKNPEMVLDERESYRRSIKWYKCTAIEILEEEEWPGKWIPIIPCIGNEIDVNGRIKYTGLIEGAMDAQRMLNYYYTKYAEAVALAPNAPWLAAEGQLEGHEDEFQQANRRAIPVLQYNPTALGGHPVPAPQRLPMPGIPEGFAHGTEMAAMEIMATTGIRLDMQTDHRSVDDRSGRAIREFNRPQELGASHYMDNLKRSLVHTGNIFVDLIPKVYDERQVVDILREDDTDGKMMIDPHAALAHQEVQKGKTKMDVFNPTIGEYGVTVTIGPSYATRRIEAMDSMMNFAKAMPTTAALIADLIAKNADWDGAEEMATRLAKAIPAQLLTPDQKDIPPQMQAYLQNLEAQIKQLTQANQQAMAALKDKQADRDIALEKIQRDFDAKLLGIIEKAEATSTKAAAENARTILDMLDKREARLHSAGMAREIAEREAAQPEPEGSKPGGEKNG